MIGLSAQEDLYYKCLVHHRFGYHHHHPNGVVKYQLAHKSVSSSSCFLSVVFGKPLVTFVFSHGLKAKGMKSTGLVNFQNMMDIYVERKILIKQQPYQAIHFLWGPPWTAA